MKFKLLVFALLGLIMSMQAVTSKKSSLPRRQITAAQEKVMEEIAKTNRVIAQTKNTILSVINAIKEKSKSEKQRILVGNLKRRFTALQNTAAFKAMSAENKALVENAFNTTAMIYFKTLTGLENIADAFNPQKTLQLMRPTINKQIAEWNNNLAKAEKIKAALQTSFTKKLGIKVQDYPGTTAIKSEAQERLVKATNITQEFLDKTVKPLLVLLRNLEQQTQHVAELQAGGY